MSNVFIEDYDNPWFTRTTSFIHKKYSSLQVFPLLVMELFGDYHGFPGLYIAAVFAAALRWGGVNIKDGFQRRILYVNIATK